MIMTIPVGTKGRAEALVTRDNTAKAAGSGTLLVFGTPFMTALMEQAASESLSAFLEEGQSSVGTKLAISHDSATPVGMEVWAESEVTAVDGRKVTFTVRAFDEKGPIGAGEHERFLIRTESFLQKTYDKI